MGNLFLKLVEMSITASWIALAVILLRLPLKKAPKWVMSLLWALVALRLVCPFSFESKLSLVPDSPALYENTASEVAPAPPPAEPIWEVEPTAPEAPIAAPDLPEVEHIAPLEPEPAEPTAPVYPQQQKPEKKPDVLQILTAVWLGGVVIMLLYTLVSYLMLLGKVRESVRLEGNVRLCDRIPTPFILGMILPKIYLPSSLAHEDTEYVLSHERAHLRRGDHLWKPLGFTLLTVYWFNPILWLAYVLMCRDIELACDEKVIKTLGEDNKRSYSMALLRCSAPRRLISACPVAFGEVCVKERIKRVLSYKKPTFWVIIAALAATAAVAVCLMTNPVDKSGIKLPEDIQITEAELSGNAIELYAGEEFAALTDEQITELKSRLSGLKTGERADEDASPYPCDIAVMTAAGEKSYEIFCKSDGTVLLKSPEEKLYNVDDKDFIEYFKTIKRESTEPESDSTQPEPSEDEMPEAIPVTLEGELDYKEVDGKAARYSLSYDDYENAVTENKNMTVETVKVRLGSTEADVTLYRDGDGKLMNVECGYEVVGFRAGDPAAGLDDVIILSKPRESGFRQYYVCCTTYSFIEGRESRSLRDQSVSLIPDRAFGIARRNFLTSVSWAEDGAVNPSCTMLAYISDKYVENGKQMHKSSVWLVDIASGCESRLELPELLSINVDARIEWLDDDNIVFSTRAGSCSVNITTGKAKKAAYAWSIPYMNGLQIVAYANDIHCTDVKSAKKVKYDVEKLNLLRPFWSVEGINIMEYGLDIDGFLSDGRYVLFGLKDQSGFGVIDVEADELKYFDLKGAPIYLLGTKNIVKNSFIYEGKLCGEGYSIDIAKLFSSGTAQPPVEPTELYKTCYGNLSLYSIDIDGVLGDVNENAISVTSKIPKGYKPSFVGGYSGASFCEIDAPDRDFDMLSYAVITDELEAEGKDYKELFRILRVGENKSSSQEVVEESFEDDGVFRYYSKIHTMLKHNEENDAIYKGEYESLYNDGWYTCYYLADLPVYDKFGKELGNCTVAFSGDLDKEDAEELVKQMDIRLTWKHDVPFRSESRLTDLENLDPKYAEHYELVKGFMQKFGFYWNYSYKRLIDFDKFTSNEAFRSYLGHLNSFLREYSWYKSVLFGDYDVTITDMEVAELKNCQTVTLRYSYGRDGNDLPQKEEHAYFVLADGENGLEIRDFVFGDSQPGRVQMPPNDPDFWKDYSKYENVQNSLVYNYRRIAEAENRGPSSFYKALPLHYILNDCYEIDARYAEQYELIRDFMTDIGFGCNPVRSSRFKAEKYTSNEKLAEYLTCCFDRRYLSEKIAPYGNRAEITIKGIEVEDKGEYQTVKFRFVCEWTYDDGTTGSRGDEVYFVTAQGENGMEILDYVDDVKSAGRDRTIPSDPSFWESEEKYGEVLKSIAERVDGLREELNGNGE